MKNTSNKPPLVSVVIPAYNREKLLPRALESVWIQNFDDLEIVIVDDGSSDNTRKFLEELQKNDDRICPQFHKINKGEAAARNTGVRSARGKYIAFLDSDDEWLPGKLNSQVKFMQSSSKDIGGCCTGQYLVDSEGREELIRDWSDDLEITGENLLIRGCGIGMGTSFLVRRSVYNTVEYYDESLPLLVDLDWLCRYAAQYRLIKIKEPYIRYYKAPIRPAEPMEIAVKLFEKKNKEYLSDFSFISRMAIKSRFFCYSAICYHEHGPWSKYIKSQLAQLLYNPRQSLKQYLYFGAVLVGLRRIGNRDQQ